VKRVLFRLAALLLPVALFALLEGGARLAGYGGQPPMIVKVADDGDHAWYATNRAGTNAFFRGRNVVGGGMRELQWRTPKLPGTVRIVFIGESAIQGFPQPLPLTNGSFLEVMLSDAWGGARRAEVLNLGATAVASYPALTILEAALDHEPDLVVAMVGNNAFYGASGVMSLPSFARSPRGVRFMRSVGGLALVQWLEARLAGGPRTSGALMERMATGDGVPPVGALRQAARDILKADLAAMVEACAARGVPLILCTSPTNERDLHPIGATTGPAAEAYARGVALTAEGKSSEAAAAFRSARDLDPMPWRATADLQGAVHEAPRAGTTLCDMEAIFRRASDGGSIGRELLDDHVHLSLEGQWLFARSIAWSMSAMPGALHVDPAALDSLPDWETYAASLGRSPFSDYLAVTHLTRLFKIPFMHRSNQAALERFEARLAALKAGMTPGDRQAVERWLDPALHGATERPVEFVVGVYRQEAGDWSGAADLFRVARVSVSPLSLWRLEIDCRLIACNRYLNDAPTAEDVRLAREAVKIGALLKANVTVPNADLDRWDGVAREALAAIETAGAR
jgi:lysophospholipase L1-like esterase